MFPLLKKDGLSLAYAASLLMWAGLALLASDQVMTLLELVNPGVELLKCCL